MWNENGPTGKVSGRSFHIAAASGEQGSDAMLI
jgi:hypothetical protein